MDFSVRKRDPTRSVPLTPAQLQIWSLSKIWPTSRYFSCSINLRFDGDLDQQLLAKAVVSLGSRHEVLRTVFKEINGSPIQIISPRPINPPLFWDLRPFSWAQICEEISKAISMHVKLCFDLENGPLMHSRLIQVSDTTHLLLIAVHHIIFDGWSADLLISDITKTYEAFLLNRDLDRSVHGFQYADFVTCQHDWLHSQGAAYQLAYWRRKLARDFSITDEPPAVVRNSFRYSGIKFSVADLICELLHAQQKNSGTTVFLSLLVSLSAVLNAWTGDNDVRIAIESANRCSPETEQIIGLLVNTLIVRTDTSGDPSFCELTKRVRESLLEGLENQALPFEHLVSELGDAKVTALMPLSVLFVLDGFGEPIRVAGTTVSIYREGLEIEEDEIIASSFDLILLIQVAPRSISGILKFRSAVFDGSKIREFTRSYIDTLQLAAESPTSKLSEISVTSHLSAAFTDPAHRRYPD